MSQERSRFHTGTLGSIPQFASHKLRARAAAGYGEDLSEVRYVNRRMREMSVTQPEGTRPAPHVITPEDVTRGMDVPLALETRIHNIVRTAVEPTTTSTKTVQPKRALAARGRLLDCLRAMKDDIGSDDRTEILRRAIHYWRTTFRIDYDRRPALRAQKSFVMPANKLAPKPRYVLLVKADGAVPAPHVKEPKVQGPGVSKTGQVAMPAVHQDSKTGRVGHKYIERKPDGHGGWLYKYPGETQFRAGAGIEQGATVAPEGKGRGAHEMGFTPSSEADEQGTHHLHFHQDVKASVPAGANRDYHKQQHAQHAEGYKGAKAAGDEEKAAAHLKAYQMHAELHNRGLAAEQKAAKQGFAPPGGAPPAELQGAAEGKRSKAGVGAQAPGTMGPAASGPPGQRPPASGAGAAGGSAQQPQGQPTPEQQGYAARIPQGTGTGQYREGIQAASQAMTDLISTHQHVADIDNRIRELKSGKNRTGNPKQQKMLIAQLQAEKAQAELDRYQHEDAHDAAMEQLKGIHAQLKGEQWKRSPVKKMIDGLLKLMGDFAKKMGHGDGGEGPAATPGEKQVEQGAGTGGAGIGPEQPTEAALGAEEPQVGPPQATEQAGALPGAGVETAPPPAGASKPGTASQTAAKPPVSHTARTVSGVQPGAQWDKDMAAARAKRDATEKQASDMGDNWRNRQLAQGKDTAAILKEQLGGSEGETEPSDRNAKTAKPGKGSSPNQYLADSIERSKKQAYEEDAKKKTRAPRRAAKSEDISDLRKAVVLSQQLYREISLLGSKLVFTPPNSRRARLEW